MQTKFLRPYRLSETLLLRLVLVAGLATLLSAPAWSGNGSSRAQEDGEDSQRESCRMVSRAYWYRVSNEQTEKGFYEVCERCGWFAERPESLDQCFERGGPKPEQCPRGKIKN